MFGDFMGMIGKIKETREKVKEAKKGLDSVIISENSPENLVSVNISANREIRSVLIEDSLLADKEKLEDYLVLTLNQAIKRATEVHDRELAAVAKEGMPNIPGIDQLFK